MENILRLFGVFLAMGGAGALTYGAVALISVMAKRADRGAGDLTALTDELADLRERIAENETLRNRVAELEERVDFAERLLAQRTETPRIGAGGVQP
jgi:Tfp pilus assembly protein PilO